MKSTVWSLLCVLVLAFGYAWTAAAAAEGSEPRAVLLSPGDAQRLGIETAPAQRMTFTPRVRGYGVVISLADIAQADSQYRAAEAAMTDSKGVLERAQRLFALHALSEQAVAAAQHQAAADMSQFVLADRKEAATFGQNAPWRGPPRDETLLDQIASGEATLLQATFPLGIAFAAPPKSLVITRIDPQPGQPHWTARSTWDAPADPAIPGRNFFALVDHTDLALGEHAIVFAPVGAPVDGVRIPAEAVVLSDDKPWCYVASAGGGFRRVPVDLQLQTAGGYFVPHGIAPNQQVVVKGTGLLLARELGPATPGEE